MILYSSRGVETHGQEAAGSWQQAVDIYHFTFFRNVSISVFCEFLMLNAHWEMRNEKWSGA